MMRPITLEIMPQPDDETCGPTCLQAVYRYHGDEVPLDRLISEIPMLETGGTLSVRLACHALRRGYRARIHTYNLQLFDPTWFNSKTDISRKLREQAAVKKDNAMLLAATASYLEFFALGGELHFEDLTYPLIRGYLDRSLPVLTGLSGTYLYRCARESGNTVLDYNDISGSPIGHFVVLWGYDEERGEIRVADPFHDNPSFGTHDYMVPAERAIGAILLGILTYDANLLIVSPTSGKGPGA